MKILMIIVITLICFSIGLLGYLVYGHITQHEMLTILVLDKQITSEQVSIKPYYTNNIYHIISESETFKTTQRLYKRIEIGSEYSILAIG